MRPLRIVIADNESIIRMDLKEMLGRSRAHCSWRSCQRSKSRGTSQEIPARLGHYGCQNAQYGRDYGG